MLDIWSTNLWTFLMFMWCPSHQYAIVQYDIMYLKDCLINSAELMEFWTFVRKLFSSTSHHVTITTKMAAIFVNKQFYKVFFFENWWNLESMYAVCVSHVKYCETEEGFRHVKSCQAWIYMYEDLLKAFLEDQLWIFNEDLCYTFGFLINLELNILNLYSA